MSTLDLSKDSRRRPAEVVSDLSLSDDAAALLSESRNTFAYLEALRERALFADAFMTLARTLPRQYAIIWAARCVEESLGPPVAQDDMHCLDVVKQWLNGPDEKLRRAAMDAADSLNFEGPYAWLAAAVGFSGGSLAPENQAEVKPPQQLTAVAISACLVLVAVDDPESYVRIGNDLLDRGLAMVAIPGESSAEH